MIHNKLPTDDNLALRGCNLPSMCSLCYKDLDSSQLIFLHCPFALALWNWLSNITHQNINMSSILGVLEVCNKGWSLQSKVVIISAVINIFNII
jgi:hypothetical protein